MNKGHLYNLKHPKCGFTILSKVTLDNKSKIESAFVLTAFTGEQPRTLIIALKGMSRNKSFAPGNDFPRHQLSKNSFVHASSYISPVSLYAACARKIDD